MEMEIPMLDDEVLSVFCCPAAKAQGRSEPLVVSGDCLVGLDRYPIRSGVPDLRLSEARKGTSYDHILPEFPAPDVSVVAETAAKMRVNAEHLRGKRVLVAGVGTGTELDIAISCEPAQVFAVDLSSHVIALAATEKYRNQGVEVVWLMGDVCNLPFVEDAFDYALSSGVLQHTRSPELAHRNIWRSVKPGGFVNYGHIYGDGLHNWLVTIDRNKCRFHMMEPEEAKRRLRRLARVYSFLMNKGLLYLFNRATRGRFRFPMLPENNGKRGETTAYYANAYFDYYLCRYRHVIPSEDVKDWFTQVGAEATRTPKGWLARKASAP